MRRVGLMFTVATAILFVGIYLVGCGASADKELGDANEAVLAAREAGAEEYAPEELAEAEELIVQAEELMARGQHNDARELLEEARFKAIEAKGKALTQAHYAQMSPQDRMVEEQILARNKSRYEAESYATSPASPSYKGSSTKSGSSRVYVDPKTGLGDIFFDFDRSDLRSDAIPVLRENSNIIRKNSNKYKLIAVEGYCDTRGTEEYNLALGQRRADSVKSYLVGLGASPSLIQSITKGETDQWAGGMSEAAFQENRRAHFVPVVK